MVNNDPGYEKKQYIFLYNKDELMLESSNNIVNWTKYPFEVKGDYFHALDYEALGISYTMLTDESNMVWIDLSNNK